MLSVINLQVKARSKIQNYFFYSNKKLKNIIIIFVSIYFLRTKKICGLQTPQSFKSHPKLLHVTVTRNHPTGCWTRRYTWLWKMISYWKKPLQCSLIQHSMKENLWEKFVVYLFEFSYIFVVFFFITFLSLNLKYFLIWNFCVSNLNINILTQRNN